MLIQPKFLTLSDPFANRLLRIPQDQRSYAWNTKERPDMFEGIARLRSRSEQRRFMATVAGVNCGQQRLTALVVMGNLMFLPAWIMYWKGWIVRV